MELGHRIGLIPGDALARLERKRRVVRETIDYLGTRLHEGKDLLRLLRRP
jgi:hypothetical protein